MFQHIRSIDYLSDFIEQNNYIVLTTAIVCQFVYAFEIVRKSSQQQLEGKSLPSSVCLPFLGIVFRLFRLFRQKTFQLLKKAALQHSTAQHSTAQHSTAQHSTALFLSLLPPLF